jgi:hypothetical protein
MAIHNPHPGEFISSVYLEPNDISGRELATTLGVANSTLSRVRQQCGQPRDGIAPFEGVGTNPGKLARHAISIRPMAR